MKAQLAIALATLRIICAASNQWTSIGPQGGIIASLVADPQNPLTIFASTSGGGIFKSRDGGGNWAALSGLPSVLCCVLAVDPQNAGTAYTAVGDGVYKTIDGGANWNLVSMRAIGFSVQTLRVTSSGALYASVGAGGGIAKSTDGGVSWTRVSSEFTLLAIDPQNPDTLYANGAPRGVLKSVDGGANWIVVNSSGYFSFLVVDPQNSDTLYAGAGWQILKSTDGEASWVSLSFGFTPTKPPVVPDGILSLAVHPKNPALLYGIVNRFVDVLGLLSSTYYLIVSTDGGETWTTATDPMLTVGDLKTILPDPTDPGTWYLGTTNGVLKTADGGASWSFENSGFQAAPIRRVVADPQTAGTLFALPDTMGQAWHGIGLFKSTDGGSSWFPSGFGLPWGVNSLLTDPMNPRTLYAAGPHSNPSFSHGSGVFKSGDEGASWNEVWAIPTPGTVIYPLAISPDAPNVLYAGVTACPYSCTPYVARSSDAGRTWTQAPTPLSTDEYLSALAIDPRDPNVVYAGTSDLGGWGTGGSFKSVDGGVSWTRTGNGAVYIILIDPGNPDGHNSLSAGPCDPLFDVFAYDPQGSGTLYCGGNAKVFRSADAGKNWTQVGSGLRGHVNSLAFGSQDSKLYAATSGGLFEIRLDSLDDSSDEASLGGHDPAAAGRSKKDRAFRRRL